VVVQVHGGLLYRVRLEGTEAPLGLVERSICELVATGEDRTG
jgi:hypothetical protein